MNFVFISPNFPNDYYHFCVSLKSHGVTVLGVGDAPHEELCPELQEVLEEYYHVKSLKNYRAVKKAVKYFEDKYGHIDWLESNNERLLVQDAKLRDDFNITTGITTQNIDIITHKSAMKHLYEQAGIKVARYHLVEGYDDCKAFIDEVGYPVIVRSDSNLKPNLTRRLNNDKDLKTFISNKPDVQMIMEEFIIGDLVSYDGIANSKREVIYETAHVYPRQVMDIVNDELDCFYWSIKEIPNNLHQAGQRVVRNFPSNSRFFHLEFFILKEDKKGLGKKGDIIGLDVNMCIPSWMEPDMMNFASDINIFDIYADMVTKDDTDINSSRKKYHCVYAARRDNHSYHIPLGEIRRLYAQDIVMTFTNPKDITDAMADQATIARFLEKEDIWPFINAIVEDHK